ncbi:hypothetical protein FRB96_006411 [Tulasnella sp. 330]|nr:hypothetical protein FRB96_006411 [Tulasnella sp. 330]KAG8886290.1 hypothetical protein FRB98_001352 [Tulasnella sp. 332]
MIVVKATTPDDDLVTIAHASEPKTMPSDPSRYERHEKHYYDDGNIIFCVESTLFRLYRGLLARYSDVMRDMSYIGSTSNQCHLHPEDDTSMEGIPVVTLHDSATDFACLLDFLLTPNFPHYPNPLPSFETCLSLLKISSKYCFDDIFESAVWHLRNTLPTSLEDFIANPGLTMFTDIRAAQVVTAAREFNLPEFVPLALYAITTYAWGSEVEPADLVLSALPQADRARAVVARTAIHSEALKVAFTMHEHGLVASSCTNPVSHSRTCAKGKPAMLWMNPSEALEEFLRNPLRQLVIRDRCEFHSLCKGCVDGIRAKMGADLEMLFARLPAIFMLLNAIFDEVSPPPAEIYLGITSDDSSIVYYRLSKGIVKPPI